MKRLLVEPRRVTRDRIVYDMTPFKTRRQSADQARCGREADYRLVSPAVCCIARLPDQSADSHGKPGGGGDGRGV